MTPPRARFAVVAAAAIAFGTQVAVLHPAAASTSLTHTAAAPAAEAAAAPATTYTAAQVLAGIQQHSTSATQVNTKPHINTMTRAMNVNVYQPASGVFVYTSSMAIDDDGSDPDPDPDHQDETTFQDSNGAQLAAHHVPFYVLGDDCWDKTSPCPHFFYKEHNISGRQFALVFYNGKVIGAIFGDTQTGNDQTTSDNDSRELGEASVEAANLLGIPDSGTTGGVDNGVTVAIFSGPSWVVNGTNSTLNANAQGMVQNALNTLGASLAGGGTTPPPTGGGSTIVNDNSGLCLSDTGGSTTLKTTGDIATCNGTAAQTWTAANGTLTNGNGLCLSVTGSSTALKAVTDIYTCNGSASEGWTVKSNGTIVNTASGLCLSVTGSSTTSGATADIYTCNGSVSENWTVGS
ncbi:RICIN domain-containing protein [Actinospica robiniae]|uniref:RICIN domain-containing protein n=1 Tax=Actinospica robiniae TaxID=304901 RepID=UPI00041DDF03|nr:RICIN domain-containing protein [Actinospica robiniae]